MEGNLIEVVKVHPKKMITKMLIGMVGIHDGAIYVDATDKSAILLVDSLIFLK